MMRAFILLLLLSATAYGQLNQDIRFIQVDGVAVVDTTTNRISTWIDGVFQLPPAPAAAAVIPDPQMDLDWAGGSLVNAGTVGATLDGILGAGGAEPLLVQPGGGKADFFRYDGNDNITLGSNTDWCDNATSFTFSVWVKVTTHVQNDAILFSLNSSSGPYLGFSLGSPTFLDANFGPMRVNLKTDPGNDVHQIVIDSINGNNQYNVGEWNYCAYSWNQANGVASTYINGVFTYSVVDAGSNPSDVARHIGVFQVGRDPTNGREIVADIGKVVGWKNVELTADQQAAIFAAESGLY